MLTKTRTSMLIAAVPVVAALVLPVASAGAHPGAPSHAPAVKKFDRHTAKSTGTRSFARLHRSMRLARSHRGGRARLASVGPQFRSPGGHIYAPSTLVCNATQIGGRDFYAETRYGAEWVSVTNTLLRWNGSTWNVRQTHSQVGAQSVYAVTDYTQWLNATNGANVGPGMAASPVFTYDASGYHAIVQDIAWFRGGTKVDSVTVTLRDGLNGYYCYH